MSNHRQAYVHTTLVFQKSPLAVPASASSPIDKADPSEPFTHDPVLINLLSLVPFLSDPISKSLFTSLSQTLVSLRSHAPTDDPVRGPTPYPPRTLYRQAAELSLDLFV
jgi:hypothetical protein